MFSYLIITLHHLHQILHHLPAKWLKEGQRYRGGDNLEISNLYSTSTILVEYERTTKKVPTMKSLDSPVKENKAAKSDEAENCDQNATVEEKIDFSNVKIEPLFEEEVDFETFSKSDFRAVKVKECVAVPKSKKLLQFTLDDGTGVDRTILSGIHAYYEPEELVGKTLIAITNLPPRKMMGIESCGMLLSAVNNLKDSEDEELHLIMVDNHIPASAKLY